MFFVININLAEINIFWRVSVAGETLTGVTQSKIGDVCLLSSERSERDTLTGNTIEISAIFIGERA